MKSGIAGKKVFALRGAAFVKNDAADIAEKTARVYDALLERNNLEEDGVISLQFSITSDIDAKNPASALRESGRASEIAMFCTQEAAFKGSPAGVLRLLLHCYLDESALPVHVYTDGAQKLRPDRA